mmetsp:Transcript_16758/g.67609  ORF Transcript_16758/g.67609 Transcript_16758/m.67609 type:complete len:588 (-) Transcript_16758:594-2357(-)|eukprot:CAMPEP_0185704720 /NCGR_PEP_ID=MMETSP1164-20130828/17938_1 /TAXON_ID=1104430 /ORGANISM="Chrysoreinhardia sp, Strain CCMP2950" /LENGTH=587 /DNA_ID=CAMNT_0028372087 /DNA_START=57 /DNA_END=1820 /DNA_ORIENTATION=+
MAFFPQIEVSELTVSGLFWLFVTYGYTLFMASSLISDGSDLLLLVPSLAGIVGSCVLPVLGAVPDGAIMLFSGLGSIDEAQDSLAVGVGALAGSTIMLLTIPWAIAGVAGRVDIDERTHTAKYTAKPKLTPAKAWSLFGCGVQPGDQVKTGAVLMLLTSISYLVIQGPCIYLEYFSSAQGPKTTAAKDHEIGSGEHWFALAGLCITLFGFVAYLWYQVSTSGDEDNIRKFRADELIKQKLRKGEITLAGAMSEIIVQEAQRGASGASRKQLLPMVHKSADYDAVAQTDESYQKPAGDAPPLLSRTASGVGRLADVVRPFFKSLDRDSNGQIDQSEASALLKALGEKPTPGRVADLFRELDADSDGQIDFGEFVGGLAKYLTAAAPPSASDADAEQGTLGDDEDEIPDEEEEEEDDVPEDIADFPPSKQQEIIKQRALVKLTVGTVLVITFSDPMVDVMSEIGVRTGINAFYVSFVLAPLASNASELIAAANFALKKTSKTITISFASLEGAACMNNTFALAIFMGLIFFRGIAWEYTAETISILVVQILVAIVAFRQPFYLAHSLLILSFYPLSILLVAALEAMGLD